MTKLGDCLLILSPNKKTKFRGLGIGQMAKAMPYLYRFEYRKILRKKESLAKKNIFVQKCDEIRRFDGTGEIDAWKLPEVENIVSYSL